MEYDEQGRELPDTTPVSLTVRQRQAVDKYELIKRQILAAVQAHAEAEEAESFEESLDFEVEDDDMPVTRAEMAELEVSDMKRTAAYVAEQEEIEHGKKRFTRKKEEPATPPAPPPAKPQG